MSRDVKLRLEEVKKELAEATKAKDATAINEAKDRLKVAEKGKAEAEKAKVEAENKVKTLQKEFKKLKKNAEKQN